VVSDLIRTTYASRSATCQAEVLHERFPVFPRLLVSLLVSACANSTGQWQRKLAFGSLLQIVELELGGILVFRLIGSQMGSNDNDSNRSFT